MTWMVPPEWCGETAFLLGCGPSMKNVCVRSLRGRGRVIAINDAFLRAPWADVLYICDKSFWREYQDTIQDVFRGRRIVTLTNVIDGVHTLRCSGAEGLDPDPGTLRHGSNGGYQAIHLAYHFGAKRIVLLGYDMHCENGRAHWRPRRRENADAQERIMRNTMLPKFPSLAEPLRQAGVEIINCTPGSHLTVWPMRPLEEVLSECPASRP